MTTATATVIHITLAQSGFAGRYPKWRVALATPDCPKEAVADARSRAGRAAKANGELLIRYVRGSRAVAEAAARSLDQKWSTGTLTIWD